MPRFGRKRWSYLGRLGFISILALLFFWKIDISLFLSYFQLQVIWNILLVQPLAFLTLFLATARLWVLLGTPSLGFPTPFKAILLNYGLNNLLPGRVGELVKTAYLREHGQVPFAMGLATVFLERIMDVFFLGLLIIIGIEWFFPGMIFFPWLALTGGVFGLLFLFPRIEHFLISVFSKMPGKIFNEKLGDWTHHVACQIREHRFLKALPIGLASWISSFLMVSSFLHFEGVIPMGEEGALAVFIASTVGLVIPALPGGIGTYEAGAILVLRQLGFPWEKALTIAVTLHVSQIPLSLAGAFFVLATERTGLSRLMRQARELAEMRGKGGIPK